MLSVMDLNEDFPLRPTLTPAFHFCLGLALVWWPVTWVKRCHMALNFF